MAASNAFLSPNTLMGLPTESQEEIISHTVQVKSVIVTMETLEGIFGLPSPYTRDGENFDYWNSIQDSKSNMIISYDPRDPFKGIPGLERIAEDNYYRVNVFRVYAAPSWEYRLQWAKQIEVRLAGPKKLVDDASIRGFVRHLELKCPVALLCQTFPFKRFDGVDELHVARQIPGLYPRLRSLTIRLFERLDDPLEDFQNVVNERWQSMTDFIKTARAFKGLRARYIHLEMLSGDQKQADETVFYIEKKTTDPVIIDGRGRNAAELAWEMLDLPNVKVRV